MLRFPTTNLRTPGPTPLPPAVRAAMAQEPVAHRGADFHRLYDALQLGLRDVLATDDPCLLVGNGGTGAMEAAMYVVPPGSCVAILSTGTFGLRFDQLARRAGLAVSLYEEPDDAPLDPYAVSQFLGDRSDVSAVFFIACETSTGIVNDPTTIIPAIRAACPNALVVVDTVSLSPVTRLCPVELGIDVLVVSSTKAMMGPPGLGIIVLSERAQDAALGRHDAPATLDLGQALAYHSKHEVPYTPPVNLFYGLEAAMDCVRAEGREVLMARHEEAAKRTQAAFHHLGLRMMAPCAAASPTVTCAWLPYGLDAHVLVDELARRHGVVLATGRVPVAHRAIRLAHMGYFSLAEIDGALAALADMNLLPSLAV